MVGRRRRALAVFQRMRDLRGDDLYAAASEAQLLAQLGQQAEATLAQQQLVDRHPGHAAGWFNLGYLLQQAGRDAEAQAAFRAAIDLQPGLDRAWYGLGLSLMRLGRLAGADGAAAAFERNTAMQPFSPLGWQQLARVYAQLGREADAARIVHRLHAFEPRVAAQLQRELGQGGAAVAGPAAGAPAAGGQTASSGVAAWN
ncbi:MAG: tetratricopeptide repeat protein [Haliea sp.]|nr:MAG: tetratricopeptide repeat protein [Haliea sp.]